MIFFVALLNTRTGLKNCKLKLSPNSIMNIMITNKKHPWFVCMKIWFCQWYFLRINTKYKQKLNSRVFYIDSDHNLFQVDNGTVTKNTIIKQWAYLELSFEQRAPPAKMRVNLNFARKLLSKQKLRSVAHPLFLLTPPSIEWNKT